MHVSSIFGMDADRNRDVLRRIFWENPPWMLSASSHKFRKYPDAGN
jgi:hypothetical protein